MCMAYIGQTVGKRVCVICARSRCRHKGPIYELSRVSPAIERHLGAYLRGLTQTSVAEDMAVAALRNGHVHLIAREHTYAVVQNMIGEEREYTWAVAPRPQLAFNLFVAKLDRITI